VADRLFDMFYIAQNWRALFPHNTRLDEKGRCEQAS